MLTRNKHITCVDISGSAIKAAAVDEDKSGNLTVQAMVKKDVLALRRGVVLDIAKAADTLKAVLQELQAKAKGINQSIYLNISGLHLRGNMSHGAVMITHPRGIIRTQDIQNVINSAYTLGISLERIPIYSRDNNYIVDEQEGIINPKGMHARKLEVDLFVISGIDNYIKNLIKCVNQAGYQVKELVPSVLAGGYGVLSEREMNSGSILIDMGAELTEAFLFVNGRPSDFVVLPAAGNDITNKLSRELKISFEYAEEIKQRYANISSARKKAEDVVLRNAEGDFKTIKSDLINTVVSDVLKDIFSQVKEDLEKKGAFGKAACGLVFTGGAATMEGAIELMQQSMGTPVRLGVPRGFANTAKTSLAAWSTCLGLARYAAFTQKAQQDLNPPRSILAKARGWAEEILTEYF